MNFEGRATHRALCDVVVRIVPQLVYNFGRDVLHRLLVVRRKPDDEQRTLWQLPVQWVLSSVPTLPQTVDSAETQVLEAKQENGLRPSKRGRVNWPVSGKWTFQSHA